MEKYRSFYPTLRQAKTKWSKPSIVAKQGEGPSHGWYEMLKKDARAKLAASIHQSHTGSIHRQERIVREDKIAVFHHDTQLQNVRMKETGIKRKKRMKDPRPTDFRRSDMKGFRESVESKANSEWVEKNVLDKPAKKKIKEDKIGKPTPSAEEIAKKHNMEVAQIQAQIDKGIKIEREHTNSDAEAHEIARDHLDEFPDYYDRLDAMEKKAKKDMKEAVKPKKTQELGKWTKETTGKDWSAILNRRAGLDDNGNPKQELGKWTKGATGKDWSAILHYMSMRLDDNGNPIKKKLKEQNKEFQWDPEVEQIRDVIGMHKKVEQHMIRQHGQNSPEATFHRAYVKRLQKQLKDRHGLDEAKKPKKVLGFKATKNDYPLPPPRIPHPVPAGYERVKDNMGFNVLRKIKEDVPNSVGGGNIAGMPTATPAEQTPVFNRSTIARRKKFAGKQVFVVDPTTFHNAYLGKRKYEHYEKYLEGCDIADEIRAYGRKYWDEPIIIENEITGAMVYLKYGSK